MNKNVILSAGGAALLLLLAGCGKSASQSAQNPNTLFDAGVSAEARAKIGAFFASIPESEKAGIDRFEIVYVDDNGKVYSNREGFGARQGRVIEQGGERFVRFSDGQEMFAPPKDDFNPKNVSANSSTWGTCNTSDGPYWRSYTKVGYAAIRGNLTVQSLSAISQVNGKSVAAYAYFGGQASNGTSQAEGGLVYHDGKLRIFFTAPDNTYANPGNSGSSYQEYVPAAGAPTFDVGTVYPTRFQVYTNGTTGGTPNGLVWVNQTNPANGITTARIIRFAATKMNVAGTDQYMKRMASIASSGFTPYTGATKYFSKSQVLTDAVQVGTWNGSSYNWAAWTSSSAFSTTSDCKWPTTAIVTTSPLNTSSSATVTTVIDMSK